VVGTAIPVELSVLEHIRSALFAEPLTAIGNAWHSVTRTQLVGAPGCTGPTRPAGCRQRLLPQCSDYMIANLSAHTTLIMQCVCTAYVITSQTTPDEQLAALMLTCLC
jgi:hypothetical protein